MESVAKGFGDIFDYVLLHLKLRPNAQNKFLI